MNSSATESTEAAACQPGPLDQCAEIVTRAPVCNAIRFIQIQLLKPFIKEAAADRATGSQTVTPAGFLILQPRAIKNGVMKPPKADEINHRIERFREQLDRWMPVTRGVESKQLPDPARKDGVNEMRSELLARGRAYGELQTDAQVVQAYKSFVRMAQRAELRSVSRLLARTGSGIGFDPRRTSDSIDRAIRNILDPELSQPLDSAHPHIALCAVFEQRWCNTGYTRGDQVTTIALAPGEEVTLEVHSWFKETERSERESEFEGETRLSDKVTSRDHFDVANELSTKGNFGANSKIELTIPLEGMPIGIGSGSDVTVDLSNTLTTTMQKTTEQTLEASNTLRSTRKVRIEEARETGRDNRQSRKIVNTNRCHTLNVHYFEVLAKYDVSLHLVEYRPCLLLPVNAPTVTPEWVLSHEHVLKSVLVDRVYLSGFEGARTLEMQERVKELELPALNEGIPTPIGVVGSGTEDEFSRLRMDILTAFRELQQTLDDNQELIDSLSNINLLQYPWDLMVDLAETVGPLLGSLPKLISWGLLEVNSDAHHALKHLEQSVPRPAVESLRNFFAVVTPLDYRYNIFAGTIVKAFHALGIPEAVVNLLVNGGLIDLIADDAGLYASVKAAHERLQADQQNAVFAAVVDGAKKGSGKAISGAAGAAETDGFTRRQLAEAKVEFERLRLHILNNCDHYFHAIWALERGCPPFAGLHGYVGLVSSTPIGFVGKKAAFPLLDPRVLEEYFDPGSIGRAWKESSAQPVKETVTLPTTGLISEVTLGRCCGCEQYVIDSRASDTRARIAEASQKEAEADRRRARLQAGDLSPFEPCCPQPAKVEKLADSHG